jgi:quercetin dioxygenase-like cupin family protein
MPVIRGATAPTYDLDHARFTGLAAPSRGSRENAAWRVSLAAGAPALPHSLDREEIIVAVSGAAVAHLDGEKQEVAAGDAIVVAAGQPFALENPHGEPFEAIAILPAGGRAAFPDGEPFVPPWAE